MGLTSTLYRLARLSADVRALRSPTCAARRRPGSAHLVPYLLPSASRSTRPEPQASRSRQGLAENWCRGWDSNPQDREASGF